MEEVWTSQRKYTRCAIPVKESFPTRLEAWIASGRAIARNPNLRWANVIAPDGSEEYEADLDPEFHARVKAAIS